MIQPITPDEVVAAKGKSFPDAVIASFNELIVQNFIHGSATVKQEDVVALMVSKGLNAAEIHKKHWLDVENVYREAGWEVTYEKPGYNESGPSLFIFALVGSSKKT